ncbi:hypothetical protein DES39_0639 [Orbus hercynius]|uniref:Lipoprotein n=1 Tax=Orbus hercynius TaxID=593135 RepID=A0A495RIP9_9GAMM|nr:hypothetical protein [Orbus hercynius]RKS87412.1 hypothetical protein DES39_0639 [Orbus hercynius]
MEKIFLLGLISVILTGCAHTSVDKGLSEMQGVTLKDVGYGQQAIDTYTVTKNVGSNVDNVKICLASNISNATVTLNDNTGSYFGAYSGHYYQNTNTSTVQGGSSIITESKDKVVGSGVAEYYSSGIIPRLQYARYIVTVSPQKNSTQYLFTQIEQASKDTGAGTNNGFSYVGAWSSADPLKVIGSLDSEVAKITNCLNNGK